MLGGTLINTRPVSKFYAIFRHSPLASISVRRTGLALLARCDTAAMAWLLAVHLGGVRALFATLPYGKFAHGIYRSGALLKSAIEKRQTSGVQMGLD